MQGFALYHSFNFLIPNTIFEICERAYFGMKNANITYYFNFNTDINHGVYWADDEDYGGLICFIPHSPVRTGYTFAGWYKEPEGINKWDFESDRLPEELLDDNGVVYQETRLYAKWVKN